jgi:TonB-dependent receptor
MKKKLINGIYAMSEFSFRIICICLLTMQISFASNSSGQTIENTTLSLELENARLSEVFKEIEERTGYTFFYNSRLKGLNQVLLIDKNNKSVEDLLQQISNETGLSFKVIGKTISVKEDIRTDEKSNTSDPSGRGIITGSIISEDSGTPLSYASVRIKNTSIGAISGENGSFRITSLADGEYTLEANFLGYQTAEVAVNVSEGAKNEVVIKMKSAFEELPGVTVTGIRLGEAKALSRMKNSNNIKYILSQEQIERFPDLTLGESLQRVPGLAVGYSYGLPNEVIIRGLDQNLSTVQINGNRIPSTSAGGRGTNLNGFLSNTVEAIEVIKTLTPDQDADGTGGTVNIITKRAESSEPIFEIKGAAGYNNLVNRPNYDFSTNYGRKTGRVDYFLGASYLRSNRGENRVLKTYRDFDLPDGSTYNGLNQIRLNEHQLKRDNLGLTADFNFDANDNFNFYLKSSYNYFYEIQWGPQLYYGINSYSAPEKFTNVLINKEGKWRDYNRHVLFLSGGGNAKFKALEMDYDLTYSSGLYDQPIYYSAGFNRSSNELTGSIDLSDRKTPLILFDQSNVNNPADFSTSRYINRHDKSEDQDIQFTLNAQQPVKIGDNKLIFKAGTRFKYKYNNRSRNYFLHDLENSVFNLADYLDKSYNNNSFFNGVYGMSDFPDSWAMEDHYQSNKNLYKNNVNYTRQNTDPDSFEGNETIFAGYLMATANFGPVEIIAGVRYENTYYKYEGNIVSLDEDGNWVSTIPVDVDGAFGDLFPSLNLKYSLTRNTNFRLAATRSLSRPSYFDLVPWEEVTNRNQRINRGNPNLRQATAVNFDLLFEHYFQSVGLISGGYFYKNIEDFLYRTSFLQEGGAFNGYRVSQTLNGADAMVNGFEIAWQQQLTFLPGFFNGFGIYLNYTYVQSKFTVPGVESERQVALPEMRPHVGNFSLSYEKFGFSGRISAYFYDDYITDLASDPIDDEYEMNRMQIDFSASQKVSNNISVFTGISNLNNSPSGDYFGTPDRPQTDFTYSWWGTLGFRYNL